MTNQENWKKIIPIFFARKISNAIFFVHLIISKSHLFHAHKCREEKHAHARLQYTRQWVEMPPDFHSTWNQENKKATLMFYHLLWNSKEGINISPTNAEICNLYTEELPMALVEEMETKVFIVLSKNYCKI